MYFCRFRYSFGKKKKKLKYHLEENNEHRPITKVDNNKQKKREKRYKPTPYHIDYDLTSLQRFGGGECFGIQVVYYFFYETCVLDGC